MKRSEQHIRESGLVSNSLISQELAAELMESYAEALLEEAVEEMTKVTIKRVGRVNEGIEIAKEIVLSLIPKEETK